MSADVVNLRRARKAARRVKVGADAAENRAAFGLTTAAREQMKAEKDRGVRQLDQHRLTPAPSSKS